ncbi:MFS transporter [Spirillospora sp. NPDC052269]
MRCRGRRWSWPCTAWRPSPAAWCTGRSPRALPSPLLLGLLGLATVPAALAHDWPWLCVAGAGAALLAAPTLSSLTDAVSRLAPASVRGEATGLHSSAYSSGFAVGGPIVGAVIDASVPGSGFVVAGLTGLAAAAAGGLLSGGLLPRRAPAGTRSESSAVGGAEAPEVLAVPAVAEAAAEPSGACAGPGV